jgi:signal peptidase II
MKLKNLYWFWLIILVVFIDQLTKYFIRCDIPENTGIHITSFFNLVHATNFGAAFSFLDIPGGAQRWLFSFISVGVSIGLLIWLFSTPREQCWQLAALSLIIGGAIGNLWDRAVHGYVIDFLQFHLGSYYYPSFNIADSAVCVGAAILVVCLLRSSKK